MGKHVNRKVADRDRSIALCDREIQLAAWFEDRLADAGIDGPEYVGLSWYTGFAPTVTWYFGDNFDEWNLVRRALAVGKMTRVFDEVGGTFAYEGMSAMTIQSVDGFTNVTVRGIGKSPACTITWVTEHKEVRRAVADCRGEDAPQDQPGTTRDETGASGAPPSSALGAEGPGASGC